MNQIQIIRYGCCGKSFAACCEPECYTDKDWMKELREYVKMGCTVEMINHGELKLEKCKCNELPKNVKPISAPNQTTLF